MPWTELYHAIQVIGSLVGLGMALLLGLVALISIRRK